MYTYLDEEHTLQLNEFEKQVVQGFDQWGKLVDAWKETAKVRIAELTEQVAHLQQKEPIDPYLPIPLSLYIILCYIYIYIYR